MAGESQREKTGTARALLKGWLTIKIRYAQKKGFPDRVYIKAGRHVWIEWKDEGKDASEQQQLRHAEMRAAGAEVYVVDSVETFYGILGI